ncbi:MAG: translation initiation factor IF-2 [Candidatus Omnitrophica bacterium]|nr:translation initiation factor IF-2 [Candidatus Omnitrophota bacterium]MDE2213930.1 translation initiation factor IF-2 [Candidatus Omnitrophota bacterium]
MKIAELAKELKITEQHITDKVHALKLRFKEGGELTAGVEMILRDALADEGIGTRPVDEPETPKKPVKKAKTAASAEKSKPKATTPKAKKSKTPARKKTALESDEEPGLEEAQPVARLKAHAPTAQPKAEVAPQPDAPKPEAPKPEAPKPEALQPSVPEILKAKPKPQAPQAPVASPKPAAPVIDVSRIDVSKEILPVEAAKKKRYDQPFISVKPLVKKRKKSHEDFAAGRGRDHKPSASIEAAVVPEAQPAGPLSDIELPIPISVKDFAVRINQKMNVVLKKLLGMGVFANINQNLGDDIVGKLANSFGFNVIKAKTNEEELIDVYQQKDDPSLLKSRAPVVTFMGHVDHGKTSLLDRIRGAKVADSEHGGITQHIGAYCVNTPHQSTITFLDTPGHEAFTAMRARGAHITDVVVLVVAADDGVMPQTQEAIAHARAANLPIVVALNKIDKKGANPDRVKKQLSELDLASEDWGGKVGVVPVSALTGEGIEDLQQRILLEAEILELRANPDKKATGIVIEAHMSKGKGAIATLIVQNGTLREGDPIVIGPLHGKVKALFDNGRPIKEAGPSMPVEILGLSEVAAAGEIFYAVEDDKKAKEIAENRQERLKNEKLSGTAKVSLEELYSQIQQGEIKELRVVIKADVQGSLEALKESLSKIPSDEVKLRFIHAAVGDVNASDVVLAQASNAIIIAFQVGVDVKARQELDKNPVDVREYRIIYDAVEDLRKALEGLLAPKLKRHFVGRVEVRNVFKLSRSGIVAGCYVQKGKVRNKAQAEVLRNGEVAHTGHISTLKRFKDDVKEVAEGFECGITVSHFDTIAVGDIIEVFDIESIARKL